MVQPVTVLLMPLRQAALLTSQVATLDRLSGGRSRSDAQSAA